jgi:hypothetical protein
MKKKDYQYTIDGKPYTWEGFIDKGRELGFKSQYDFISTSMVAGYLRKIGHKVGNYQPK